jgi:hypothetical protein
VVHILQVLACPSGLPDYAPLYVKKHKEEIMLQRHNAWNDRRIALVLSIVCLGMLALAGCGSSSTTKAKPTATPTPHAAALVPAGFAMYKSTSFHLAYPTGWAEQHPANGTGVQYQGPTNQLFIAANLGKLAATPEAFDTAFCTPNGFGGAPEGAPKTVTINGQKWVQLQCNDAKGGKSATVEATKYNNQLYYMVYASPIASFQNNVAHYFTTMEQSFTFAA